MHANLKDISCLSCKHAAKLTGCEPCFSCWRNDYDLKMSNFEIAYDVIVAKTVPFKDEPMSDYDILEARVAELEFKYTQLLAMFIDIFKEHHNV